jgi:hypothetical protein
MKKKGTYRSYFEKYIIRISNWLKKTGRGKKKGGRKSKNSPVEGRV